VDIYFQANGKWVAMEIECTTARIRNDIAKADALRADLLLIVLPDARTTRAARAAISRLTKGSVAAAGRIQAQSFGAALQ
jgi:hypothetical protein